MTLDNKLTYIKGNCMGMIACQYCRLDLGVTCPEKLWKDWTADEIETAFNIIYGGEVDDAES